MKRVFVVLGVIAMLVGAGSAMAAATGKLKDAKFDSSNEARQRGAEAVIYTCMLCHSLKYVKFSDLTNIGLSKEQIEGLLDDQKIEDRMMSVTPIEVRKESYGKVPPDLSLMAIARKKGPQYIYTLLTGYYYREDGETDNHLFPGIKMPDALGYSDTEEGSSDRADVEAQARDLVSFLVWTADPNAETRRSIGYYVIIYLIILTILLYFVKKRVWRKVEKSKVEVPS